MRRFLAAFLLLIFILIGSGCNQANKKSSSDGASVSPQPSNTQEDANEERPKEKIHEVPSEKVYFNHSLHYVELPFVEVLELVGATVNWESETRATVSIDNRCFTLDTKEYFFKENGDFWNWFAPPPGANPYADDYPHIKDCFVLDNRVFGFLLDELGFTLTVDFEAETVHISRLSDEVLYPDGMPTSSALSISLAETKLQQVSNGENIYFICDTIDFYQNRIYYIFQKCEDYADRVVTSAWYAVDVFTGEIYRYNDLGDKKLFEKIN